jgi:hypothetical protein
VIGTSTARFAARGRISKPPPTARGAKSAICADGVRAAHVIIPAGQVRVHSTILVVCGQAGTGIGRPRTTPAGSSTECTSLLCPNRTFTGVHPMVERAPANLFQSIALLVKRNTVHLRGGVPADETVVVEGIAARNYSRLAIGEPQRPTLRRERQLPSNQTRLADLIATQGSGIAEVAPCKISRVKARHAIPNASVTVNVRDIRVVDDVYVVMYHIYIVIAAIKAMPIPWMEQLKGS